MGSEVVGCSRTGDVSSPHRTERLKALCKENGSFSLCHSAAFCLMPLEGFSLISSALAVNVACTGAAKCLGLLWDSLGKQLSPTQPIIHSLIPKWVVGKGKEE